MDKTLQPGIRIAQIFLERSTFSHREDALALTPDTHFEPELAMSFQGGVAPDGKSGYVRIGVETKADQRPLYNFDVTMTALFIVDAKKPNLSIKDYVQTAAPVMLFPFLREAVAGITGRGRFGAVWLSPFNVAEALKSIQAASDKTETAKALPKIERPSRAAKKRSKSKSRT